MSEILIVKNKKQGLTSVKLDTLVNEHIFIVIETPDRPTLSIDIANQHGRRDLSLRVNGMTVGGLLADVVELPPMSDGVLRRFCPYCGERRDLFASVDRHKCPAEESV